MDRQTTVSYRRMSTATVTGLPTDFTLTDKVFDLSVAATEARDGMEFQFLRPVTVTVFLTGEEATAFNDSHSNVAIQRFDPNTMEWVPLQTTIDLAARTVQVQILAPNSLALTVKKPVSSPERVLTYGPVLPQGYLGAGMVSLTIPKELGATNTARVSLRIALGGESPANRSTPRSGEGQITPEGQPPTVGDSLGVVREAPVPVHRRMSFTLDAPGFEMAPLGEVPQQVRDGQAGWSWIITPNEGPLGEREVSALVTANGQTLSTLKTSVMVTRPEPRTTMTTDAGIYPRPTATSLPIPVPTVTPVVKLATVVVPLASQAPTPVATPTGEPLPIPTASPVPVSPPTAVPSTTPKANERLATATATPTIKLSPSPRFRLFINGVQAPALNDMMSVGGRPLVLSQAAEADGTFQFNDKVTIAVTLPSGYRVEWRGVDTVRGPFATVYMNQDRFVALDVVSPTITPTPIPRPVPFYQPRPRAIERPTIVPTPTPPPVRTYALTVGSVPEEGGSVSPEGVTRHRAGAQVSLTATPADGYVFSHWSGLCSTSLACVVTMDGDQMVAAHFTPVFELTTFPSPADGGIVVPSDATLHRASTRVTVMSSPAEGRQFSQWTGDCSGSGACVVTMNSGKSVTAEFVRVFDLTTEAIPPEGGAILPEGKTSHREDTQVTVITSPADGYQFSEWGGDCSGDGPCVVTIEGPETVTAKFLPVSDLTVTADPEDGGTVIPGGVTSYVDNTQVTVLAHPGPGYRFSNWSGACTGDGPCVVTIDGDTTVTAKFDRGVDLTVTANPPSGGTVLPQGSTSHNPGTTVTIVASPAEGYQFSEWTGDCSGIGDCVITMDGTKSVAANFVRLFTLTAQANLPAGGTVSPDSTTSHTKGSHVTVIANPTDGYQFSDWSGDCTGSGACVVTMDADKSVKANFAPVFDLTVAADPANGGTVLPGGVTSYVDGTNLTVLAYPAAGYRFSEWSGACTGDGPCLVTIDEDKAVTAKFARGVDLTVTTNPPDGGTVLPSGKTSHRPGAAVTVVANPADGYQFSEWSGDCSGNGTCVVTMNGAKSVTAEFVRVFNLTAEANPLGGGVISPGTNTAHESGSEVTTIANPTDGYQFSEWAGDCTGSDPCVVTMDDNKSVAANFVRLFTLTAQANPPAGGTVSPDSTTSHIAGSKITVVANPTEGYQFSEWGGDCSGRGACVVAMDADQSVMAKFAPVFDLTVTADPAEGGTVLPGGMTSYVDGTKVTVLAYPAAGYRFSKWSGDCSGSGPCLVTIDEDKAVTVKFARGVDLTVAANPPDGGTMLPASETSHRPGAAVTVVAIPADGYQFSEWSGDCTGSSACVVTMDTAKSVTAEFVRVFDLTVTAVPTGGGALSPGDNTAHASGTEVTVIANPADAYQFSEWAGDCTGSDGCVVTMNSDKSVTAIFVGVFTLTTHANLPAGGTVSPDNATSHTADSHVTVIANPTDGHQFSGWGGDCTGRSPCVVTMDADKSVTANFASVLDLIVTADPVDGGTVLPGGVTSYVDGTNLTVLAYPAAGYRFSEWSGACTGDGPCLVTIDEDKAVTAKFVRGVDLTVAAHPPHGGTVLPSGETSHSSGAAVTIVATPADGYQFSEWTGDCSGSGACVVTMDAAKSVTANFVGVFDLTVTAVPTGGGTVFPGSTTSYVAGYEVAVLARSAVGYQFSEWSGDCSGDSACVVTMDADKSVTANFGPVFKLTATASPNEGGTILPKGIPSFLAGTQVTVLAHSAPDYQLYGWTGACSGGGPCVVTMDADKSVTANFAEVFDLTVASSPVNGGTVFPSGTTSYAENHQVTVTARPGYGYGFSGWDGDCSGSGPCVVTMDDNKTVTANFIKQFVLTAVASPPAGGEVTPPGTTQHAEGTEVTVTASPAEGYGFSGWSGDCSGTGPCLVIMDGDKTVTANFFTRFTLTTMAEPSSGGTVSPEGTTSYDAGTQVTVTATPASGYNFSGWSGDCSGSDSCVVTMDGDKSVTAKFTSTAAIAFHSSRDGNSEIYIMDTDGSNMTRLTNNSTADSDPNWSHDGNKIAFVATRDGNSEIYVMNVDGSSPVNLTNNEAEDISPAWSPDGARIAFVSTRGSQQDIYVMDADGSNQTKLTDDAHLDDSPDWSPDGAKIVFASQRDDDYEIYTILADGSGAARLTNSEGDDLSPVWSPDGETIAFASFRDGDAEIYTMLADGTNDYNITFAVTEDESPAWSPDSAKIILVSDQTDIVIFDAEDPESIEAITITTGGSSDGGLDWKPNPASED